MHSYSSEFPTDHQTSPPPPPSFSLFLPVSFNSGEDRNLASFGLSGDGHENTETNLLQEHMDSCLLGSGLVLARAGEGRIFPIHFLISDFGLMVGREFTTLPSNIKILCF